jgi:hypothetical protein
MSAAPARFFHRAKEDGTYDSICMICYRAIDTQLREAALATKEKFHVCNQHDLLPREYLVKTLAEEQALSLQEFVRKKTA